MGKRCTAGLQEYGCCMPAGTIRLHKGWEGCRKGFEWGEERWNGEDVEQMDGL